MREGARITADSFVILGLTSHPTHTFFPFHMPFYNSCDLRGNPTDYIIEMLPKFATQSVPSPPRAPCKPPQAPCKCAPRQRRCSSYAQETLPLYIDFQWNSMRYDS